MAEIEKVNSPIRNDAIADQTWATNRMNFVNEMYL